MAATIAALGREGPPSKIRDGRFTFFCPHCGEMLAYVNPKNNLAHCFACHKTLNNIDLLRSLGHDFRSAITLLERWLDHYHQDRDSAMLCGSHSRIPSKPRPGHPPEGPVAPGTVGLADRRCDAAGDGALEEPPNGAGRQAQPADFLCPNQTHSGSDRSRTGDGGCCRRRAGPGRSAVDCRHRIR